MHPAVRRWLDALSREGKSEKTIRAYESDLRLFVRRFEESYAQSFDPSSVIPRDIADYKAHLLTVRRASPSTVNRKLAALSRFFKWAVSQGYARTDATEGIRGLRKERLKPRALSPQELRRFLRAVHRGGNLRDIALSELLSLTRGDISLSKRSGFLTVRQGKGGTHRRVPIPAPARKALREYLEAHQGMGPDDPLWVGQRGPLASESGLYRLVAKYARRAGIPEFGPHTLRHTFAGRYLAANPGDLRGLASLLGHASLNTVMIYTEPTSEALAERVERIEQVTG